MTDEPKRDDDTRRRKRARERIFGERPEFSLNEKTFGEPLEDDDDTDTDTDKDAPPRARQ